MRAPPNYRVVDPALTYGPHVFDAVGLTSGILTRVAYNVLAKVRLKPTSGLPGALVTCKISGMRAFQSISVHWSTKTGQILATVVADVNGSATATIPTDTLTTHNVYAIEPDNVSATAKFNVT